MSELLVPAKIPYNPMLPSWHAYSNRGPRRFFEVASLLGKSLIMDMAWGLVKRQAAIGAVWMG